MLLRGSDSSLWSSQAGADRSGESPKDFENKDNVAVLNAAKDAAAAGFEFLQKPDEQPAAGKVGVYVPSGAVFSIKSGPYQTRAKGS